jgi:hypothetical protein
MKRQELIQLALLGMAAAALVGGQSLEAQTTTPSATTQGATAHKPAGDTAPSCGCPATVSKPLTSEQQTFYNKLNDQGKQMFMKMDTEGRSTAMQAFKAPVGGNSCAGLNACSNPGKNDCMGKGTSKNSSVKTFTDPNQAVKVTYDKMQAKRKTLQGL